MAVGEFSSDRREANRLADIASIESDSVWGIVRAVFKPLASLRLTVALLAMGLFIVLVGTLAQVDKGMWEVMEDYFTSWIAVIEFQVFFPRSWFPSWQNVPGKFLFPGGALIGSVMVLNLIAAHAVRFKVQARGARLATGLAMILLGVWVTFLVVVSGHNHEGLQADPPFEWKTLWLGIKVLLLAVAAATGLATVALMPQRRQRAFEWTVCAVSTVALAFLSIWLLLQGDSAYLGNSGMRILWQLIQGGLAGIILLVGCVLVFGQRAGIALLHGGVGLLMFGQFFVSRYDVEEQIRIGEGETINYGQDIRAVELAVVDRDQPDHPDEDLVIVVPMTKNGKKSRLLRNKRIEAAQLPFVLEIIDYYRNSELREWKPGDDNPATHGRGVRTIAEANKIVGGAEGSEVNLASVYVRVSRDDDGTLLGTYMLSQWYTNGEMVEVDDHSYELSLRFKRSYKPYSMHLIDVRKDDYVGTSTPRNYSSDVRLVDHQRHEDRPVHIWMNNPLRYAGETFYQSGYTDIEGREYTTLQVVRNSGWMIPYVACMHVATGMLWHFLLKLTRFLRRRGPLPRASMSHGLANIAVPVVLVAVMGLWIASTFRAPRTPSDECDLARFSELPLAYKGRVKPFDTLARNSLVVISDRSSLRDASGDKQPAIRWLMDVMTQSPEARRHRVFRIQNLEVLDLLALRRRKGFRYSLAEIEPRMQKFRRQVELARAVKTEQLSVFQKKVLELEERLQKYLQIQESFRMPDAKLTAPLERSQMLLALANIRQELSSSPVPRAVPSENTGSENDSWLPFAVAATDLWIKQLANSANVTNTGQLAKHFVDCVLSDESLDEFVPLRVIGTISEFIRDKYPKATDNELHGLSEQMFQEMDEGMRNGLLQSVRQTVKDEAPQLQAEFEHAISAALGGRQLDTPPNSTAQSLATLFVAYSENDAATFNREVDQLLEKHKLDSPEEYHASAAGLEVIFNRMAPFYSATVLYLVAFVLTAAGWLGWRGPLIRSATWLIVLALLVHTLALAARIYISGRPPVTNLYSSAVFIGWAGVVLGLGLEILYRLGIGNALAAVGGFSTLFIAHQLSLDGDTLEVLQAVLDTQFWLATHVVCITLGYTTTYLAGLLGIAYILGGIFAPLPPSVRKELTRMTYGVLCFSIFFSFVGTVLGGLWADDSWGRFWGWDPKENGALIIVLWNALVLHARWGGLVQQRGLAVLATVGNIAVSWSWFGVNELGVGLHSYGFTEGVVVKLVVAVCLHLGIIGLGLLPTRLWSSHRQPTQV